MEYLSEDEAKVLATLHLSVASPVSRHAFEEERFFPVLESWRGLQSIAHYGENGAPELPKCEDAQSTARWIHLGTRVWHACVLLNERELTKIQHHSHVPNVFVAQLTRDGYDVGKKWSTKWGRMDARYRMHKEGLPGALLTAIIGMIFGVIGGLIGFWLT